MSQPASHQTPRPEPLRLLCFDGGGVRGLASLCLLRQILSYVGNPKPCEYFDMIGGTSTGGLIAIMLGRLEMTIDDAIEAYSTMIGDVFKRKNILPVNPFNAKAIPKYHARVLEDKILSIIEANGHARMAKFRTHPPKKCRVFVVAKQTQPSCIVYFTDWEQLGESTNMYNEVTICDVALATTAASTFFPPAEVVFNGTVFEFVDGGLGENNPIVALRNFATEYFVGHGRKNFAEDLRVILSIGTGKPPSHSISGSVKGLARELIALATETQKTHNDFMSQIKGTPLHDQYMRFNPPDLMAQVKLDDYKHRALIIGMVEKYSAEQETRILFSKFSAVAEPLNPMPGNNIQPPILDRVSPSLAWFALGGNENWIDHCAGGYWSRMTLKSFNIYERIYECCSKEQGYVHYRSFLNQLPPGSWAAHSLERVWSRLHNGNNGQPAVNSFFPKGFVLAVTYMLHVEQYNQHILPTDDHGKQGAVAPGRREQMKHWANWVFCGCSSTCRTEWNFANDTGLVRNGGTSDQCETIWWRDASRTKRSLFPGRKERLEKVNSVWCKTNYEHERRSR